MNCQAIQYQIQNHRVHPFGKMQRLDCVCYFEKITVIPFGSYRKIPVNKVTRQISKPNSYDKISSLLRSCTGRCLKQYSNRPLLWKQIAKYGYKSKRGGVRQSVHRDKLHRESSPLH